MWRINHWVVRVVKINLENIKILANPESTLREKRDAENAILENNIGLRQQLKNRFKPELVQEKDVGEARRNWDAQVDFYFSQLLTKHLNTYKRAQAQGVDDQATALAIALG